MANLMYNAGKMNSLNGTIDYDTNTIKCALVTSAYTPDRDAHDYFNDITNEIVSAGYTAGGATLTVTVTQDNTNDRGVFDANDVTWVGITAAPRGAVIYKSTGTAATSPLIAYIDFVTDQTCTAQDFTIAWASTGIIYI
jgi:hypothetical protein